MKFAIKLLSRFIFFSILCLIAGVGAKSAYAQSCSGSITCGTRVNTVCTIGGSPSGASCSRSDPGCVCNDVCVNSAGASCTGYSGSPAACNARAICETSIGVCLISGSCSYTPPSGGGGGGPTPPGSTPAPTSPPSNGACGSCNSCGAPQAECALINGVCSKAGYCGGTGGCGCGAYSPTCGGQACNTICNNGFNGTGYVCIQCNAAATWVGLGTFDNPNCTNNACPPGGLPAPTGIVPNGSTANSGVQNFQWNGVVGATNYNWAVVDDTTGGVVSGSINFPYAGPYNFIIGHNYRLGVTALSASCGNASTIVSFTAGASGPAPTPTPTPVPPPTCGNGVCSGETCASCPADCGACPPGPTPTPIPATPTPTPVPTPVPTPPPVACTAPSPVDDPGNGVCANSATSTALTTWSWPDVSPANSYFFQLRRASDDSVVIPNAPHTGASLGCGTGTCSISVSVLPGTYYSLVSARSTAGLCTPDSPVSQSPDWTLPVCTSTITATIYEDPSGAATLIGGAGPGATCGGGGTGTYTGGGSVTATSQSGTPYTGAVNGSGTATIPGVPNGSNYTLTFTPPAGIVLTCPATGTYPNKDVPSNPVNPVFYASSIADSWYQTIGGDIAALGGGTSVQDSIPEALCPITGCSAYLSLPLGGGPETVGSLLVTSGGGADLGSASGTQDDIVGNPNRLIRLYAGKPLRLKESYDYFYRLYSVGVSPAEEFSCPSNCPTDARKPSGGAQKFFYRNGDLTINSHQWTIGGGQNITVFVNGNLVVGNEIKVQPNGFLAFIVKGNITFSPTVGTATYTQTNDGQVQGVYFADGSLTVASAGVGGTDLKFIGEGTFVGKSGISLPRDFRNGGNGIQNNIGPATLFLYRPDLLINAPDEMKSSTFTWKEINP